MNSKTMMSRGLSHKGQDQNPFLPKLQVEDCQDHGACTTLAGDKQTSGGQPSPKHPSKASHQRHREEIESEGEEGNIERPAMTTPSPPPPAFENSEKPNREAQLRQSPRTHQALSQAYVRQLKRELPHELSGYPKKGVRSRFPHTIQQVMNMREEVKQEVAEELEKEFDEQGINSLSCGNPENAKSGLSSPQYKACMDALHRKRTAALRAMKPQERERAQFMLDSVKLHVEEVAQKEVGDSLLRFYSPLAQNRSTCRSKTEGSVPNTRQHGNV